MTKKAVNCETSLPEQVRPWKKALSVFLAVVMAVGSLVALVAGTYKVQQFLGIKSVLSAYAEDIVDTDGVVAVNLDTMKQDSSVIDLKKSDGSNVLYNFSEPISFVDENGKVRTKDTSVVKQRDRSLKKRGYTYSNGENDYRINFGKSASLGVYVNAGGCEYTVKPLGACDSLGNEGTGKILGEEFEVFEYKNLYAKGTNLRFYPQLNGVKDEIVLDSDIGKSSFAFTLSVKGCTAKLNDDGSVSLISNKTGEQVQSFSAPYAFDSEFVEGDYDEHYSPCKYSLKKAGSGEYTLAVNVDSKWLKSESTVYPVTIDPTTGHINNTHDTGIYSKYPKNCYGKEQTCCFGLSEYGYGRTLMHFTMPTAIKAGATISSAYMWERETTGRTTSTKVTPYLVKDTWSENYTTWETRPTWDTTVAMSTRTISSKSTDDPDNSYWYKFNIAPAVKKWVSGANANRGVVFISSEEKDKNQNWRAFASKQYSTSAMRPYSVITYTNDATAPTATVSKTPTSWTNGSVTVKISSAKDNSGGAGLHASPYSFSASSTYSWGTATSKTFTSNGTVKVSVRDKNDNIRTYSVIIDNIDKTAPSAPSVSGAPAQWTNEDVTLTASSSDSASGVKEYVYTVDGAEEIVSSDGKQTFTDYSEVSVAARDNAGNLSAQTPVSVLIDKTEPQITGVSAVKSDDKTSSPLHVSVSAEDDLSGVAKYSIDGGEHWQTESEFDTDIPEGNLSVKVMDEAGNTADKVTSVSNPAFYEEGQLVGLIDSTHSSKSLQYRFSEDEEWTDYEAPFGIPFGDGVTVYARYADADSCVSKKFTAKTELLSPYTESNVDAALTCKNLFFEFGRYYNSSQGEWFFAVNSRVNTTHSQDILTAVLPDSSRLTFIKTGEDSYVNELSGYTLRKVFGEDKRLSGYVISTGEEFFDYSSDGVLVSTRDKYGDKIIFTRTQNSIVVCADIAGEDNLPTYTYTLDESGNIVSLTDPQGGKVKYSYDSNNRLTEVKDQAGVILGTYEYSLDGRLKKSLDKSLTYNSDGMLSEVKYDSGAFEKYTYSTDISSGTLNITVEDNTLEKTTESYNCAFMVVSSSQGEETTEYRYDAKHRVVKEISDGDIVRYSYDENGNLLSQLHGEEETSQEGTDPDPADGSGGGDSNAEGVETPVKPTQTEKEDDVYNYYDSSNRLIRTQVNSDNTYYVYGSDDTVTLVATLKEGYTGEAPEEYDSTLTCFDTISYTYVGGLVKTSTDSSSGEVVNYEYDAYGNPVKTTVSKGTEAPVITNASYDLLGNITQSSTNGENSSYIYDPAGRVLLSNENGEYTRTLFDSYGRTVQEIGKEDYDSSKDGLPDSNTYSDKTAGQTYVYAADGTLSSETNRLGIKTDYTYSANGCKKTEKFDIYEFIYCDHGDLLEVKTGGKTAVKYSYDSEYNLTRTDYANGDSVRCEYDAEGNLSAEYHGDSSSPYVTYTYTEGELTCKEDSDADLRYIYGENDTVTVSRLSDGTELYTYSERSDETAQEGEEPQNRNVTETHFGTPYDTLYGDKDILWSDSEYSYTVKDSSSEDESETVDTETFAYNGENALSVSYTYDDKGNITKKSYSAKWSDGSPLTYESVNEYDAQGRIISSGLDSSAKNTYTYDSKGQLIRADSGFITVYPRTYSYDERGNITSKKVYDAYNNGEDSESIQTYDFEYSADSAKDRLISVNGTALTYDSLGNVLTYGDKSYKWEKGRNLKSVTSGENTYSYTYDEEGIRQSKTVNGKTTYFNTSDGTVLSQTDGENTYVFRYDENGSPLGFVYNGTPYWYLTNISGDVVALTDADGKLIYQYYYDEWGELLAEVPDDNITAEQEQAAKNNPLRYRGYYYDSETGYYYLQSRYYDPTICRFINADSYEYLSKDMLIGLNSFVYCVNDPVNKTDMSGTASSSNSNYYNTGKNIKIKGKKYRVVHPKNAKKYKEDKSWKYLKTFKLKKGFNSANFFDKASLELSLTVSAAVVTLAVLDSINITYLTAFSRTVKVNGKNMRQVVFSISITEDRKLYSTYAGGSHNVDMFMTSAMQRVFFRDKVKTLYKKLTKKKPKKYMSIRLTVDKLHKDFDYSYFLSCNYQGKLVLKPVIFPKDKIEIIGGKSVWSFHKTLYTIPLNKSIRTNKTLAQLEKYIKNV